MKLKMKDIKHQDFIYRVKKREGKKKERERRTPRRKERQVCNKRREQPYVLPRSQVLILIEFQKYT